MNVLIILKLQIHCVMKVLSRQPKNKSIEQTVSDYKFQTLCNTICDRYCYCVWVKTIELEKNPAKDKWEIPAIISLILIVGVNYCLPILNLSKIMVHIYTTGKTINQFSIGYMINP